MDGQEPSGDQPRPIPVRRRSFTAAPDPAPRTPPAPPRAAPPAPPPGPPARPGAAAPSGRQVPGRSRGGQSQPQRRPDRPGSPPAPARRVSEGRHAPQGHGRAPLQGDGGAGRRGPGGARPDGPRDTAYPTPGKRRTFRRRRIVALVLLALLAWVIFLVWVPVSAWNRVERVDNVPAGERPAAGRGATFLLVGSDSREGLTAAQIAELATGPDEGGKRTDSIMLVHVSDHGAKPSIVSIPRDSYVPIPGHGSNKINAAYAFGGAKLLTQTVEQATGLRLDGYLEIGFGGFAGIVDGLGGVEVCVAADMKDPKAGIDLKAGCQTLNGPEALGYVRSRYTDPLGDFGRAARQRQFLGAVMKKASTPATVLVPTRYSAFADAASKGLVVGEDTSLTEAISVLQAMRQVGNGSGLSMQVPVATAALATTNAGVAVKWDTPAAKVLFAALRNDEDLVAPPAGTTPG
ncbi:MAG: LCP family protein [Actinomycetales bacterium]|nr:LCP family protein [Actinomycetales bacterium]